MRKHRIITLLEGKTIKLKNGCSVTYPRTICLYCGKTFGLDDWQLRKMPVSLACCSDEAAPKMKLRERLLLSVDCVVLF